MQDRLLTNGAPRCTVIQTIAGGVVVIGPGAKPRLELKSLEEATKEIEERGWVVGISHPTVMAKIKKEE